MIEILCLLLVGAIGWDHHTRLKALGQEARNYGKTEA